MIDSPWKCIEKFRFPREIDTFSYTEYTITINKKSIVVMPLWISLFHQERQSW